MFFDKYYKHLLITPTCSLSTLLRARKSVVEYIAEQIESEGKKYCNCFFEPENLTLNVVNELYWNNNFYNIVESDQIKEAICLQFACCCPFCSFVIYHVETIMRLNDDENED